MEGEWVFLTLADILYRVKVSKSGLYYHFVITWALLAEYLNCGRIFGIHQNGAVRVLVFPGLIVCVIWVMCFHIVEIGFIIVWIFIYAIFYGSFVKRSELMGDSKTDFPCSIQSFLCVYLNTLLSISLTKFIDLLSFDSFLIGTDGG